MGNNAIVRHKAGNAVPVPASVAKHGQQIVSAEAWQLM
jgi:hypothetical protein